MLGRKMLLHFLHSLHPCNSAIAEEQKSALPPSPVNRATEPAYFALQIGKLFMTVSLAAAFNRGDTRCVV